MAPSTPAVNEQLRQFRTRIKDLKLTGKKNTDVYLSRWIRAKSSLEESEKMLRKSLKWREENHIDEIESWKPPDIFKDFLQQVDFDGVDKENYPIMTYAMGNWPLQQLVDLGLEDSLHKSFVLLVERINRKMEGKYTKSGEPIDQFIAIRDFDGVPFNRPVLNMVAQASRVIAENYPGQLKTAIVVNARLPYYLTIKYVSPLTQKFIGLENLCQEMLTFGFNAEEWQRALKQRIASDQLPVVLGGTRKCVYKGYQS